jgi:hypothetical protein
MLSSDFEREVQHKMEELRFTPPDAVWDNIEASLPQKNRRRLVFFWLLLGLLAGSGTWYFMQKGSSENDEQAVVRASEKVQEKQLATTKQANERLTDGKQAPVNANDATGDVSGPAKRMKAKAITPPVKTRDASSQATGSTQTKKGIGVPGYVQQKESIAQTSNRKIVPTEKINNDKDVVRYGVVYSTVKAGGNDAGADDRTLPATIDDAGKTTRSSIGPGHLFLAKEADHYDKTTVVNETAKSDDATSMAIAAGSTIIATGNAAKPSIAKKKQYSWEFGLHAGAGISNVTNRIFEKAMSASDPLNNSGGSAGGGVVGSGSAFKTNADPIAGFTYAAGLYGEKTFAKNWSFYTGLQYQYATNKILVGSKVDSAISLNFSDTRLESNVFYRGGVSSTYTNHYHMLQLPVLVKYRPIAGWPLYLEAGGSISYLAGSNGLQYNATRNAYISSDDAFNRWLFSGNLGAGVKLAQKTKLPLHLGYRFGYTATSLTKEAFGRQHLSASLLYLEMRLNK